MKKLTTSNTLLTVIILVFCQSCQITKNYGHARGKKSDNTTFIKSPQGYCVYDKTMPAENDVINALAMAEGVNPKSFVLFQECQEKKAFFEGNEPRFRKIMEIRFYTPDYIKTLKEQGADRDRESFVKFKEMESSKETVQSLNQYIKNEFLPEIRKGDLKIVDKSPNLNNKQKKELKLLNADTFYNKQHEILSYSVKSIPSLVTYDYQRYKVGNLTMSCIGAQTMIKYTPISFAICEESPKENWDGLELKIGTYVKDMIRLNGDD